MSPVRKLLALLILLVTVAVAGLPLALFSARADLSFGPHEASYSLSADGRLTVDFGPLGRLLLPAEGRLPAGLGLEIEVGQIPVSGEDEENTVNATNRRAEDKELPEAAEVGAGGGIIDALGGDIASYAALVSAPRAQIDEVVVGLSRAILLRWALVTCIVSGVLVGLAFFLGQERVRSCGRAFIGKEFSASFLAASLALGGIVAAAQHRPDPVVPDPAFAGTPLAGGHVTGRLGGVIDAAFATVRDFAADNDAFYDDVLVELDKEWPQRPLTGNWSDRGLVPPAGVGRTGVSGSGTTTLLFASDIHCNIGMARVLGEVAGRAGVQAYVDGGDMTMTGTSAENYCLDVVDAQLPEDLPRVFVKGNHDSTDTVAHARAQGWNVLEDSTAEVAGIDFYGGPDPRRTVFGSGPLLETSLTADQYARELAADACGQEFDILLIHDPRIAAPALRSGCADYALSGHWHRHIGPEHIGHGVQYVSSTTGGALANALTPGPLKMPAELSLIRVDDDTDRPIDVQTITVGTDRRVSFSDWARFPAPLPPAVPVTDPETTSAPGG